MAQRELHEGDTTRSPKLQLVAPAAPPEQHLEAPAALPHTANGRYGSTAGMKRIEGGAFLMGTDYPKAFRADGEGPVREVRLDPFFIDICAVSNTQFEEFVAATKYRTEAETFGWSYVFHKHVTPKAKEKMQGVAAGTEWWLGIEGANWMRPEGPGSNIKKRMDHPVVHISWNDAVAYCEWAGKRLPSEAEWECAARGDLVQQLYPWGDTLLVDGKHRCNIWQGKFPHFNSGADGYSATAPVKSFAPNGFGLYNVSGNVWEWSRDWFSPSFHINGPRENPQGPPEGTMKLIKGGSHLCHESYCNRYRVAARTGNTPDSASSHCGFRCARDA